MRYVVAFGRFWWDFIIGDDWKIAAGVFAVLAGGAALVAGTNLSDTAITLLVGCGILGVATGSIVAGALAAAKDAGK
jgi:hypothetical protein